LQVYCTLQPVLRFAPFPFSRIIAPARLRAVRPILLIFPGSAVFLHTLQSFSLVIRRTASPRPLPSRRSDRPQGFARLTSPLSRPGVATRPDPLLSWASFPFRVLPSRSACIRSARTGPAATRARPSLVHPRFRGLDLRHSVALAGFFLNTEWIAPVLCPNSFPTSTFAATFPGLFSCTHLHANAQKDTQAGPPKTMPLRLVALLLYFGFPNTDCLRCRDRLSMTSHQAWPKTTDPPQFPARDPWLMYFYRRAERKKSSEHRSASKGSLATFASVQNLHTSVVPVARRMWRILFEQDCRPSWGFVRQRSTWG